MKKAAIVVSILAALAFLFFPIHTERYENGTKLTQALAYTVVEWCACDGTYENTRTFWFPDNRHSLENLYKIECDLRQAETH